MYKCRNYFDKESMQNLYFSFIYPYLTYRVKIWGNACNIHLDPIVKGECSVFKKNYIMDENDSLSEYNKILLGHNCTNGAVYSKIYFNVEICSTY